MNIHPHIGFDNIRFGSSRTKVQKILGEPTAKELVDFPDGGSTDCWVYERLEVELNFDSDENFKLTRITFSSNSAELEGVCINGKSEKELLEHFPKAYLEDTSEELGSNYEYPESEISFWVVDAKVKNFTLFVPFDDSGEKILWPE